MLSAGRQSAWMSNITNDGLTRSGTGCFIAEPYGNSGRQRVNTNKTLLGTANGILTLGRPINRSIFKMA